MAPRPWMPAGGIEHTEPRSLRAAGRCLRPRAPEMNINILPPPDDSQQLGIFLSFFHLPHLLDLSLLLRMEHKRHGVALPVPFLPCSLLTRVYSLKILAYQDDNRLKKLNS
ncbi:uncharacterized protein AAES06_022412 isoform 1-T1 [Glossophaga mutica]